MRRHFADSPGGLPDLRLGSVPIRFSPTPPPDSFVTGGRSAVALLCFFFAGKGEHPTPDRVRYPHTISFQ